MATFEDERMFELLKSIEDMIKVKNVNGALNVIRLLMTALSKEE